VDAIANPIRRDLQLFVLLTGLRSADARTVRWEHVDFERGTVHRPKPKGGEDRAFTVPVSRAVLEILRRRRDENCLLYPDDHGWVFPSKDMEGRVSHVAQAKEQRYEMGRKVEHLPSPHRLRDTFASAAHEARVHPLDLKVLMNHTLPAGDDVTEGYIRPSIEHLRGAVEQVAAFLLGKMQQGG
jgi:integrase